MGEKPRHGCFAGIIARIESTKETTHHCLGQQRYIHVCAWRRYGFRMCAYVYMQREDCRLRWLPLPLPMSSSLLLASWWRTLSCFLSLPSTFFLTPPSTSPRLKLSVHMYNLTLSQHRRPHFPFTSVAVDLGAAVAFRFDPELEPEPPPLCPSSLPPPA